MKTNYPFESLTKKLIYRAMQRFIRISREVDAASTDEFGFDNFIKAEILLPTFPHYLAVKLLHIGFQRSSS
jgi:hypothetical protein